VDGWWELVGCPHCCGELRPGKGGEAVCSHCGAAFALRGGIPDLWHPEDRRRLIGRVKAADPWAWPAGCAPPSPGLAAQMRRETCRALLRLLAEEGPAPEEGPVAVLGGNIGWLGRCLAEKGYHVLALEALAGENGAEDAPPADGAPQKYILAWGHAEHPPLRAGRFCLIVLEGSLYHVQNVPAALQRLAGGLQTQGRLILMDTPLGPQWPVAMEHGGRLLRRDQLHEELVAAGLRPRWIELPRGLHWWRYTARAWLRAEPWFELPLVVAYRAPKRR